MTAMTGASASPGEHPPVPPFDLSDYDYVIRVIQFLDERYGIRFFISTRDFDVLYHWWEKRIPIDIVEHSLAAVVDRFRKRGKPLRQMESFAYEVRKSYRGFLTMETSQSRRLDESEPLALFRRFLEDFPEEIGILKPDFEKWLRQSAAGKPFDPDPLHEKLLALFRGDEELNSKVRFFIRNLAPELRKPEIERKYRLNYLLNRFRVPFIR